MTATILLTPEDIQAALKCSRSTAYAHLRRALGRGPGEGARNDLAGLLKRSHVSSREPARPARRKPASARRDEGADHVRNVAP